MNDPLVLLFHSTDERDLCSLRNLGNVRPEVFERLLARLKKEFVVVSLEDLITGIRQGRASEEKLLAITFDDGAVSYATQAVPIMRSLAIPSTCFLITGCINDHAVYWRYLLNFCVNSGVGPELAALLSYAYGVRVAPEDVIRFTRNNYDKEKNRRVISSILEHIVSLQEYREREQGLFLSFDDLARLKDDPLVRFGIHTQTHPVMMDLGDKDIHDEISESLAFHKKFIGDFVPMFSVPFGRLYRDYDERTVRQALELGIEIILSAYGGCNSTGQPLYNIRRVPVNEGILEDLDAFIGMLRNPLPPVAYSEQEKRLSHLLSL